MIVYVVTSDSGKYRKFEAIFDNRKQAAYYRALRGCDDTQIEEWDTEAYQFTGSQPLLSLWLATVTEDNEFTHLSEQFTFDAERTQCQLESEGWDVSLTMEYGATKEQVKKIILEIVAAARNKK